MLSRKNLPLFCFKIPKFVLKAIDFSQVFTKKQRLKGISATIQFHFSNHKVPNLRIVFTSFIRVTRAFSLPKMGDPGHVCKYKYVEFYDTY